MRFRSLVGIVVICGSLGFGAGCGGGDDAPGGAVDAAPTPDAAPAADAAPPCTPNAKECVTDKLARICPEDGSGWLAVPCGEREVCDPERGECVFDLTDCIPGEGVCTGDTMGLRCNTSGTGFEVVTCPSGTQCVGAGQCAGRCVVGESYCLGTGAVTTCADGQSFTTVTCTGGTLCVATSETTAACKPAECEPDPNGCDYVCGNKADPSADQTKFVSFCNPTPQGYRWISFECPGLSTCDPAAGWCFGGFQADCVQECTPGSQRCVDQVTYQTCGPDGKWGDPVACSPDLGDVTTVCMPKESDPTKVVCGDVVCALGEGTCTLDGKFRECVDGFLEPENMAAPCATGLCQSEEGIAAVSPGQCVPECTDGEERCTPGGGSTYQECKNGVWQAPVACKDANGNLLNCFGYEDALGLQRKICGGECVPGSVRCDPNATDEYGLRLKQQRCDDMGKWGSSVECELGYCFEGDDGVGRCIAPCLPGTPVCLFASSELTCTNKGRLPPLSEAASCGAGESCRIDGGRHYGCVECIGSDVSRRPESECVDGDTLRVCQSDNTWGAPTDCDPGLSCFEDPNVGAYCDAMVN